MDIFFLFIKVINERNFSLWTSYDYHKKVGGPLFTSFLL